MKKIILIVLLFSVCSYGQDFDYKEYNSFLKKNVSSTGKVNYKGIKKHQSELEAIIYEFEKTNPTIKIWSREEELAYFINLYNIHTLKIIVSHYPVESPKDIKGVWSKNVIKLGKRMISLSYVEHRILRKMNEPRIHFAINCASVSCPNLLNRAFLPETIDNQLEAVTKLFINDKTKNTLTENEIQISEIFNWFSTDFKTKNTTLIDFINKYSNVKINKKAKVNYLNYNWDLNEKL